MKFVAAIFAICLIAAACGKQSPSAVVSTEMDLAILKDDGSIYQDKIAHRFELGPVPNSTRSESTQRAQASHGANPEYNVYLRELPGKEGINTEISIQISEDGPAGQSLAHLTFKIQGKAISSYPVIREVCSTGGSTNCVLQSAIISKESVDHLGNRTRLFKHTSENYTRDQSGIHYCSLDLETSNVEWRESSYVGSEAPAHATYKHGFLASKYLADSGASMNLVVTCYKQPQKTRGEPSTWLSVFRATLKQSRQ